MGTMILAKKVLLTLKINMTACGLPHVRKVTINVHQYLHQTIGKIIMYEIY